jgi:hypothetical protein
LVFNHLIELLDREKCVMVGIGVLQSFLELEESSSSLRG